MPTLQPERFTDPGELGERLAAKIAGEIRAAAAEGRNYVLGCPAGRTPLPVYTALSRRLAGTDLSRLQIVMMDEFVERSGNGWRRIPPGQPHSCLGFAQRHIAAALATLPAGNLHAPDPAEPAAYERLIEGLGGIDLFLLASGASDGHVAFNPPGAPLDSPTRIVRLAEATRRDNLSTFPTLCELGAVPTHGVSVGLGTIAGRSRHAVMILHGAHKGPALRRLLDLQRFDPDWPASVIFACRNPRLYVDAAAMASA